MGTVTPLPKTPLAAIIDAAKPIAEIVRPFAGRDVDLIPIEAGELRRLLAAIDAAEKRLKVRS